MRLGAQRNPATCQMSSLSPERDPELLFLQDPAQIPSRALVPLGSSTDSIPKPILSLLPLPRDRGGDQRASPAPPEPARPIPQPLPQSGGHQGCATARIPCFLPFPPSSVLCEQPVSLGAGDCSKSSLRPDCFISRDILTAQHSGRAQVPLQGREGGHWEGLCL